MSHDRMSRDKTNGLTSLSMDEVAKEGRPKVNPRAAVRDLTNCANLTHCSVLLRYVMFCSDRDLLCSVLFCYVMLCMLYCVVCYVVWTLSYVMLCCFMLSYVVLCCVVSVFYVMLCDVMLCYAMLCYVMLSYVFFCFAMLCSAKKNI